MLSDEMTTGSVTTLDADKRVYAGRSHAWNLQQRRFREAFPEVSTHILCVIKGYAPPDIAPKSIMIVALDWVMGISDLPSSSGQVIFY